MARNALTIVLITRDLVVRADVSPGAPAALKGVWSQPRPDLPDLPSQVEAALHLGPRPARKTWVLATDLWTQTLELPVHRSADASAAELASALNFEAEALSGLSAFEAVVGQVSLATREGLRTHWLVQVRSADLDLIDDVVRQAGSKLMGVGHPGGLVRPAAAGPERSWQRIELWPDAVVIQRSTAEEALDLFVVNSDPQMGRWQADAQERERQGPPVQYKELLMAAGIEAPAQLEGRQMLWLQHPDTLAAWLVACGEQLVRRRPSVPLVAPTPIPLSLAKRRAIAAAVALLTLAFCGGHYLWLDQDISAASAELAQLQEPAKRLPELEKKLKDLDGQANKLKEETRKVKLHADKLVGQRQRLVRLLHTLAKHRAEDLLVQQIANDKGEPRIQGICLEPELADQFATWLAQELRPNGSLPHGWDVQPPKKTAKNLVANGGPWHFEITCKIPVGPASAEMSAAGASVLNPRRR